MGFLEMKSVSSKTRDDYLQRFTMFNEWARGQRLPLNTLEERDRALSRYGSHLFERGGSSSDFSKTRAASAFWWDDVSKSGLELPRAKRAQIGFTKIAPESSRVPMPYVMMCALAAQLLLDQKPVEMACAVILMFIGYLRPCDALPLHCEQLVPPTRAAGRGHQHWSLLLHQEGSGSTSKVGAKDENLVLDNPDYHWFNPSLAQLRERHSGGKVFKFTYSELNTAVQKSLLALKYQEAGVQHLYQLRHGGASHEAAAGSRSLMDIKLRGRWSSARNMLRYEKGGRLAQVIARLAPQQLTWATACRDRLPAQLATSFWQQSSSRLPSK